MVGGKEGSTGYFELRLGCSNNELNTAACGAIVLSSAKK
jgi:hypothetical protein